MSATAFFDRLLCAIGLRPLMHNLNAVEGR